MPSCEMDQCGKSAGSNNDGIRKKTARVCGDEVHAILVCPIVDLQLLLQRHTAKNDSLDEHEVGQARYTYPSYRAHPWKPLIMSTVISCPA